MGQPFQPQALYDYLRAFDAGVNTGIDPALLPPNQLADARNVTVRGTFATHRPAFRKINLATATPAATNSWLQDACYYSPDPGSGSDSIRAIINGRLFEFVPDTIGNAGITEITPILSGKLDVNPTIAQNGPLIASIWQSEAWTIAMDGISRPIISGPTGPNTSRRARSIDSEQPVGSIPSIGSASNQNANPVTAPAIGNTAPWTFNLANPYDYADNGLPIQVEIDDPSGATIGQALLYSAGNVTTSPPTDNTNAVLKNISDTATTEPAGNVLLMAEQSTVKSSVGTVLTGATYSPVTGNFIPSDTLAQPTVFDSRNAGSILTSQVNAAINYTAPVTGTVSNTKAVAALSVPAQWVQQTTGSGLVVEATTQADFTYQNAATGLQDTGLHIGSSNYFSQGAVTWFALRILDHSNNPQKPPASPGGVIGVGPNSDNILSLTVTSTDQLGTTLYCTIPTTTTPLPTVGWHLFETATVSANKTVIVDSITALSLLLAQTTSGSVPVSVIGPSSNVIGSGWTVTGVTSNGATLANNATNISIPIHSTIQFLSNNVISGGTAITIPVATLNLIVGNDNQPLAAGDSVIIQNSLGGNFTATVSSVNTTTPSITVVGAPLTEASCQIDNGATINRVFNGVVSGNQTLALQIPVGDSSKFNAGVDHILIGTTVTGLSLTGVVQSSAGGVLTVLVDPSVPNCSLAFQANIYIVLNQGSAYFNVIPNLPTFLYSVGQQVQVISYDPLYPGTFTGIVYQVFPQYLVLEDTTGSATKIVFSFGNPILSQVGSSVISITLKQSNAIITAGSLLYIGGNKYVGAVTVVSGATVTLTSNQTTAATINTGDDVEAVTASTIFVPLATLTYGFTPPAIGQTVAVVVSWSATAQIANIVIGNANGPAYTITPQTPVTTINTNSNNEVSLVNLTIPEKTVINPGSTLNALPELPIGKMGTYGMGRNWICLPDGRSFVASDLVGGSSGTLENQYRDAVLMMTENFQLANGGSFRCPSSGADIRSMNFTATLDASLGQGPLQVGTPDETFSCNAPIDRTTWQSLTTPILTESLISNGPQGQRGAVVVNGDLMFRANDGIRSLILARRDFDQWGNVPISLEVEEYIAGDSQALLQFVTSAQFDNRLLVAVGPVLNQSACPVGVYHTGLVALNFDPISSLRGKAPSVWDGYWTGLNIIKMVTGTFNGVKRCFAFCASTSLQNLELWEMLPTGASTYDVTATGATPIGWSITGHTMDFGQTDPKKRDLLRLEDGEIYVDNLTGTVTFTALYRPDQNSVWIPWFGWQETADPSQTTSGELAFRPRMGLGRPNPGATDPFTNRPYREGYTFDFRIDIIGDCRFKGARFKATTIPQSEFSKPNPNGT
jgi:hypothetical protein